VNHTPVRKYLSVERPYRPDLEDSTIFSESVRGTEKKQRGKWTIYCRKDVCGFRNVTV